jgi:hypothetical protein
VAESSSLDGQVRGRGTGGMGRLEDLEGECIGAGELSGSTWRQEEGEAALAAPLDLRRSICLTARKGVQGSESKDYFSASMNKCVPPQPD